MHHPTRPTADRMRTERSTKPSVNPYYVDDVALTLTDVLRARRAESVSASR